jgi:hypothetical protein
MLLMTEDILSRFSVASRSPRSIGERAQKNIDREPNLVGNSWKFMSGFKV